MSGRIRYLLIMLIFVVSAVVYIDRSNMSIAGLDLIRPMVGTTSSWAGCKAPSCWAMPFSRFPPAGWWARSAPARP